MSTCALMGLILLKCFSKIVGNRALMQKYCFATGHLANWKYRWPILPKTWNDHCRFRLCRSKEGKILPFAIISACFGKLFSYLGTSRLSQNNRIIAIDNGSVTFTYRNRQRDNEIEEMTLDAHEFIRRFLLHVLPKGLIKIRYFGFLSHTNKNKEVPLIRKLIDPDATLPDKIKETILEMMLRLTGIDITCCPKCMKGKMINIRKLPKDELNSS